MKKISKSLLYIVIAVLISIFSSLLLTNNYQEGLHLRLSNFLYSTATRHTGDVTVVKIDAKSLTKQEDGGLGRWQNWKRGYYATVIDNLKKAGASVIGIDIFFSEPSSDALYKDLTEFTKRYNEPNLEKNAQEFAKREDALLANALKANPNVFLAAKLGMYDNEQLLPTTEILPKENTQLASIEVFEDQDNITRKAPLLTGDSRTWAGFALRLSSEYLGLSQKDLIENSNSLTVLPVKIKDTNTAKNYGPINIPKDIQGRMMVNFFGGPFTIPTISFVDVYNNTFDPALVKNKIILIGEMDAGLHDDVYSPLSIGSSMPGVEFHANAIETILTNQSPKNADALLEILIICVSVFLFTCLFAILRPLPSFILLLLYIPIYFAFAIFLFAQYLIIINLVHAPLAVFLTFITVMGYNNFLVEKEKKRAIHAFSHYVSKQVVHKMLKNPDLLTLGGEKKMVAVAFTDIAGFTTLSEAISPENLVAFLHDYLSEMTSIILKYDGTLDKYIGDAMMYFWNAPIEQGDFAKKSLLAILEIHEALPRILEKWKHIPEFAKIDIRTGLAIGDVIVGNFGSEDRFDYTVIGDKVNLASRIEGANKEYASKICINEDAMDLAGNDFIYRELDTIKVKGKNQPVQIYELIGEKKKVHENTLQMVKVFNDALALYKNKDFTKAHAWFENCYKKYDDETSKVYMNRCEIFLKHPPEKNWNGVFEMKTK